MSLRNHFRFINHILLTIFFSTLDSLKKILKITFILKMIDFRLRCSVKRFSFHIKLTWALSWRVLGLFRLRIFQILGKIRLKLKIVWSNISLWRIFVPAKIFRWSFAFIRHKTLSFINLFLFLANFWRLTISFLF
jgi:hypothetical protein